MPAQNPLTQPLCHNANFFLAYFFVSHSLVRSIFSKVVLFFARARLTPEIYILSLSLLGLTINDV